jgi:hypothetical protein
MPSARALRTLFAALLCLAALPASSALAAKPAKPVVSSVGPLNVHVGDTLTIRGRGFLAGPKADSVAFRSGSAKAISVRAATATATRLTVVVPAGVAKSFKVAGGVAQPTRFAVRVRAKGMSKWYKARRLSALIVPADGAGGAGTLPAHCVQDTVSPLTDPLDDVVPNLDNADDLALDPLTDPVEAAAEKQLCSGATAADDPPPPDATGLGVDPDADPGADPGADDPGVDDPSAG